MSPARWARPREPWPVSIAAAMADYIDHFYNYDRRHSSLGYHTPNEFEASYLAPIHQAALS